MKSKTTTILVIFFSISGILMAQAEQGSAPFTGNTLQVYFFLLVFATIINRVLEYLKVLLIWLDSRKGLLQKIGHYLWLFIERKMKQLGLDIDEKKIRPKLNSLVIATILHLLGFIIGIAICVSLDIGLIDALGFNPGGRLINNVATGLLAGAGIDPIHSVFRLLQEKKKIKKLLAKLPG